MKNTAGDCQSPTRSQEQERFRNILGGTSNLTGIFPSVFSHGPTRAIFLAAKVPQKMSGAALADVCDRTYSPAGQKFKDNVRTTVPRLEAAKEMLLCHLSNPLIETDHSTLIRFGFPGIFQKLQNPLRGITTL